MRNTSRIIACLLLLFFSSLSLVYGQTTSWTGTTSTSWSVSTNWTNGVPTATLDAVLGDANFTGVNQPTTNATSSSKSLTLGGSRATNLTLTKNLTVAGNVTINGNGTITHPASTLSLTGNWLNNGTYNATTTTSSVIFSGTTQSYGGSTVTIFRKLTINTASVLTLNANLNCTGSSSLLSLSGTLNPNEAPTYSTTADNFTINSGGIAKVTAANITSNYVVNTAFTLSSGCIVEYSATLTDQVINSNVSYSTLRISGAGKTKRLIADLPLLRSTSSSVGNIYVLSGTLDLGAYTANRGTTVAGGTFSISNGATMKIGGINSFPLAYSSVTLNLTSSVEYNGGDQTISARTYGNLLLTSGSGGVTKTFPATAFTVAGSLTSSVGSGTSVAYTAAAALTITGAINIGASTTFNASSFAITVTGNWNNEGIFIPATSTVTLKGANTLISGIASQPFYNLTVSGSNVTAPSITDLSISGNFATSGSGTFTLPATSNFIMSGTTKTIAGTGITLGNFSATGVITTSTSFILAGNLGCTNSFIASGGIITMSGASKTVTNSGTLTLRGLLVTGTVQTTSSFTISASLNTSGSFTATAGTITFSSVSLFTGTSNLFNVTINGTSLTLSANAIMGIAGAFNITAGSFTVSSYLPNTVVYNGNGAQTIKNTTYDNLVLANGGTKSTTAAFTINNTFTISTGVTFDAGSFVHVMVGNWVNNGSFIAGTGGITFSGATNSSISGSSLSTFYTLNVSKTLATYTINLLTNVSVGTINMTTGNMNTGSYTLTITTTRTGNAIILGTITRNHAFASGLAYAFEGPANTILFATGVTAVNSVTINVKSAPVSDFPYNGAISREYNVSIPAGSYDATLRLHYEETELNGNDETVMQLWRNNGASWIVSGKTANNASTNYVEKSGITNINARWSMTDDGSVLKWTGATSSDWSDGSNWSLIQGTFSGAPASTDIVQIGLAAFTNQPIITTAANIKSMTLGSTQPVNLTLNTGGSLVASGGISGSWTGDAVHTINVNAQPLTVNGDISLSDNTINHSINLSIGVGTVTVAGLLQQSGNAGLVFSGAGMLNIGKDYIYSGGTFTGGTGTVKYTGTISQTAAAIPYYNLSIVKSAGTTATINGNASVAGSLIISSGELNMSGNLPIAGSVTISNGATFTANASSLAVGGNWSKGTSGIFDPGTATLLLNGTGTQTISASSFNAVTINKSAGSVVLSGNNTVNGDVSVLAGTLNLAGFFLNQSSSGSTFTLANATTLIVAGANNFPTSFNNYSFANTSLVQYTGTGVQSVAAITYGNLSFSGGGTNDKTLLGSFTVNGDITISSGSTVNAGNYDITLYGNWSNAGTFKAGTGNMLLNGVAKTLIGNTTFFDFTVNGSYSVISSDMSFNGQFEVTSTGEYVAGSGVGTVNGDFINSGSVSSSGTVTFSGTVLQTIRLINAIQSTSTGIVNFNGTVSPLFNSTSTPVFAILNINNTAGISPSVNWIVGNDFTVSSGSSFNGGVYTHSFRGNFMNNGTVTSAGSLVLNPAIDVTARLSGSNFSSTGTLILGGTGIITIEGTPTSLLNVRVTNTNPAGVTTPSGWTMNGKFTINSNSIFNAGAYNYTVGGNIESDGTLNGGGSTFIMSSSDGDLTASATTTFNHFTVTGSITPQTDFRVAGDFMNNGTYDGSIGALIMTGNNNANIGGTAAPFNMTQLSIEKTSNAVITQTANLSNVLFLNINTGILSTSTRTITQDPIGGVLVINTGATLRLGGVNSLPGFSGYNLAVRSNVDYAGTAQSVGNATDYGNLLITAAGSKTAFVPIVVRGDLLISDGTLATSTVTVTHTIAGDFIMTGGTLTGTASTYTFNGTTDQTLTVLSNLINARVNKPSGKLILGSLVGISQALTLTNGLVSLGNYNLEMGATGTILNYSSTRYMLAEGTGSLYQPIGAGANKIFPVGSSSYYVPSTVALAGGSTADDIGVRVFQGVRTGALYGDYYQSAMVDNTWVISEKIAGGSNATVTVEWPGAAEQSAFQRTSCRLHYNNGTYWDGGPGDAAASGTDPYYIGRAGFTGFGVYAVSTLRALPVTWLDVTAVNKTDGNHINWGTASESNNSYFVVEWSGDGKKFQSLGTVNGQGTTSTSHQYEFLHTGITGGAYYYRIRQVDIDGRFTYSKIIKLEVAVKEQLVTRLYPIPAGETITLEIISKKAKELTIAIHTINGERVKQIDTKIATGVNKIVIGLSELSSGVYTISVSDGNEKQFIQQIVKR